MKFEDFVIKEASAIATMGTLVATNPTTGGNYFLIGHTVWYVDKYTNKILNRGNFNDFTASVNNGRTNARWVDDSNLPGM